MIILARQQRAAAGVGIELGEDQAVELELLVERLGAVDRVLAAHGIEHEINLVRLELRVDLLQLAHQLIIDVQSPGGVEDDDIAAGLLGLLHRGAADGHRRALGDLAMRGDFGRSV